MEEIKYKKRIFQYLHKEIGFQPKVVKCYDESKTSEIDMYIGEDRPDIGLSTYATIGLSEYSIGLQCTDGRELRTEFISLCNSDVEFFPNIIATCAFNIIKDGYSCKPGAVYPNVIEEYYENLNMKHIYFTAPYLWENLGSVDMGDRMVAWLLPIPISDSEFEYLKKNGDEKFEELLEKNQVDIFDFYRKSVI